MWYQYHHYTRDKSTRLSCDPKGYKFTCGNNVAGGECLQVEGYLGPITILGSRFYRSVGVRTHFKPFLITGS